MPREAFFLPRRDEVFVHDKARSAVMIEGKLPRLIFTKAPHFSRGFDR